MDKREEFFKAYNQYLKKIGETPEEDTNAVKYELAYTEKLDYNCSLVVNYNIKEEQLEYYMFNDHIAIELCVDEPIQQITSYIKNTEWQDWIDERPIEEEMLNNIQNSYNKSNYEDLILMPDELLKNLLIEEAPKFGYSKASETKIQLT